MWARSARLWPGPADRSGGDPAAGRISAEAAAYSTIPPAIPPLASTLRRGIMAKPLFDEFLILSVPMEANSVAPPHTDATPTVSWRLSEAMASASAAGAARVAAAAAPSYNDNEVAQFCFPYIESLKKMTARSMPVADEFVFVLSDSGSDEGASGFGLM